MFKGIIGLLAVLFVAGSSLTYAQDVSRPRLSQTDFNILTDVRLGIVKAVLQLTPEQAKYWPAIEDAVRARAQARYQQTVAVAERVSQQRDIDPIELLRGRANALAQRAAGLNKLIDAWQPLYQSLDPDQKQRMRLLAARVLPQLKDAVDSRRMATYDEDDDDDR
ncbi:MAG TPA: Spy/CpxP family protein refolding chaperone [Xanthobacteraceae bacterium]|nr:Spy/CpxP family protein refolding chaperone [Xanthobacteraceae bacterium]